MTIYVDRLMAYTVNQVTKLWCHMASDQRGDAGLVELHAMADKIGMKREWFQDRENLPHYDLQPSKRALAIRYGAIEVDATELLKKCRQTPLPVKKKVKKSNDTKAGRGRRAR